MGYSNDSNTLKYFFLLYVLNSQDSENDNCIFFLISFLQITENLYFVYLFHRIITLLFYWSSWFSRTKLLEYKKYAYIHVKYYMYVYFLYVYIISFCNNLLCLFIFLFEAVAFNTFRCFIYFVFIFSIYKYQEKCFFKSKKNLHLYLINIFCFVFTVH